MSAPRDSGRRTRSPDAGVQIASTVNKPGQAVSDAPQHAEQAALRIIDGADAMRRKDSDRGKRPADVATQVGSALERLGQAVWDALHHVDKALDRYSDATDALLGLEKLLTELHRRVVRPKGRVFVGDFEAFVADVLAWARCGLGYAAAMRDEGLRLLDKKTAERREARERDGVPADAPPGAHIRGAVCIYVHDDRAAHLPTRGDVGAWRERLGDVLDRLERLRRLLPSPKLGRPSVNDPLDRRICDGWNTNEYRTYKECARAFTTESHRVTAADVRRALDRQRARDRRGERAVK